MRAFIAIDIENPEIVKKMEELGKKLAKVTEVKLVKPENMHITLKFLGEIREETADEILQRLRDACAGFGRFEVNVRGTGGFPSDGRARVVWVGAEAPEIYPLKRIIDAVLKDFGFAPDRDFVSHITIARVKGDWKMAGKFVREFKNFEGGKFTARSVKLKQSILTGEGPIYRNIGEVEL